MGQEKIVMSLSIVNSSFGDLTDGRRQIWAVLNLFVITVWCLIFFLLHCNFFLVPHSERTNVSIFFRSFLISFVQFGGAKRISVELVNLTRMVLIFKKCQFTSAKLTQIHFCEDNLGFNEFLFENTDFMKIFHGNHIEIFEVASSYPLIIGNVNIKKWWAGLFGNASFYWIYRCYVELSF